MCCFSVKCNLFSFCIEKRLQNICICRRLSIILLIEIFQKHKLNNFQTMDKVRKNNSKKQELLSDKEEFYKKIPTIILTTEAFNALQNNHKTALYAKMRQFFTPPRTNSAFYTWFREPESIPAMGFDWIVNVMRECLTETINDILNDAKTKVAELSETINTFEKYIQDNGTTTN